MTDQFSITILISGRGSNLLHLIRKAESYQVCRVVSDHDNAPGLEIARAEGIPVVSYDRGRLGSVKGSKAAILSHLCAEPPHLVVLAGFMQLLTPPFIESFPGRIINIHPSLLPSYPGLDTHARVLAAGDTTHGCTVHIVDQGIDTGPIIAQASCECGAGDTPTTLSKRVLTLEHELYPWVVNRIATGQIHLHPTGITCSDQTRSEALARGFTMGSCEARRGE
jgi:phosphoribosylglycinamide formyltransferase-1